MSNEMVRELQTALTAHEAYQLTGRADMIDTAAAALRALATLVKDAAAVAVAGLDLPAARAQEVSRGA